MATGVGSSSALDTLDTFPKLLLHHAKVRGGRPAIREKDLGIWQTCAQVQVCQMPRSFSRIAGSAPRTRACIISSLGNVSCVPMSDFIEAAPPPRTGGILTHKAAFLQCSERPRDA